MSYESESEYATSYYRCIDPIENFRIKVILKPVKNPVIPLPHFDVDQSSSVIFENDNNQEVEEYTFQWQEKVFSKIELKKHKESTGKKKLHEKYHGKIFMDITNKRSHLQRLFTYVEVDDYTHQENKDQSASAGKKNNKTSVTSVKLKNFGNIPKAKIINYNPSKEYKNENDLLNNKFVQRMFIMVDFNDNNKETAKEDNHGVLCTLNYHLNSKLLEMTPSFSKSQLRPYIIGINSQDSRNFYYYWLIHASTNISTNSLRKEIGIMAKVLNHQNELKKLLIGTEFTVGQPHHLYITLLGEIVKASDFEYDHLHVNYYVKLSDGWQCNEPESLSGFTHTSTSNSHGIVHFSHLFEMNLFVDLQSFEGHVLTSPEVIFEVLSVDKYSRYRNEGYTYIQVPESAGMFDYNLRCWRASDKKIKSELERFFIGGGPELEDISYVGLSNSQRVELISRFGFETRPSGNLKVKLNILHQSESLKRKDVVDESKRLRDVQGKSDADTLLSTVNTVLEAFRKARARMLQAKRGLEPELNSIDHELQNGFSKLTLKSRKTRPLET